MAQLLVRLSLQPRLLLLTHGAQAPTPLASPAVWPTCSGGWGLARVLRQEQPALRTAIVDVPRADACWGVLSGDLSFHCGEPMVHTFGVSRPGWSTYPVYLWLLISRPEK